MPHESAAALARRGHPRRGRLERRFGDGAPRPADPLRTRGHDHLRHRPAAVVTDKGDIFQVERFDRVGGLDFPEGETEQHGEREDLGDRVGDALAGDVGSGAAGWFVEAEVEAVLTLFS